jgi:hypothetical protein
VEDIGWWVVAVAAAVVVVNGPGVGGWS